jgi:hypothetical protein
MRQFVIGCLCLAPLFASAHDLLLHAESDGHTITGTAYYSNGEKAAHEAVSLVDLSTVGAGPVATHTNAEGNFSFKVDASHRYRVNLYGVEGHKAEVELIAQPPAKRELIDRGSTMETEKLWLPLAWAIIGSIALMSLAPLARSRP